MWRRSIPLPHLLTASGPAVRLFSTRPMVLIALEPANGAFSAADIDRSTVTLERADHAAAPIRPVPDKAPAEDADHDGIAELALAFRNGDLRAMLEDLPPGESDVSFWVRGAMVTGGRFAAPLHLKVDAGKKGLAAAVSPNPMNPTAALTFRTRQPGPARVVLFDVRGRVVRVLLDEPASRRDTTISRWVGIRVAICPPASTSTGSSLPRGAGPESWS